MKPETTFQKFSNYQKIFGLKGLVLAVRTKLSRKPRETQAVPPGGKYPAFIRLKTSDLKTFVKIFIDREYEISLKISPKVIVDAGANVGYASIFFAIKYPDAKIIAIEPEPSNFVQLKRNVAAYPNVIPVQAALWSKDALLDLFDPGFGSWAFQARAGSPEENAQALGKVQGLTIATVMRDHGLTAIDILKVDIEGAEREVFAGSPIWLNSVSAILIELHDRLHPGCAHNFYSATKDFQRKIEQGENIILLRDDSVG